MVQYTLAQSPEVILTVPGKDSTKSEKAMDQLVELMDTGELDIELSEGFGPRQFIEVKESVTVDDSGEDASKPCRFSTAWSHLKLKVQELRAEALVSRSGGHPVHG